MPLLGLPLGFYLLLACWASSLVVWRFLKGLVLLGRGSKKGKLPPGPTPLPLVGNCAQIDIRNPHLSFVRWKQQFGPIYTVWLPKPQVVIAGAQELNELLVSPNYAGIFADRPTFSFLFGIFGKHQPDGDGIILARQQVWQKNRRFALSAFRNLGLKGPRVEALICMHKDALIRRLADANNGLITDWQPQLAFCLGNVIQDLVMGRHYEHFDDPEFMLFKQLLGSTIREFTSVQMQMVDRFPYLRCLFPAYWRYVRDGFELQRFFMREIDAHVRHLRAAGHEGQADCFIDAYLEAAAEEGINWDDPALRLSLTLCSGDLWAGGLETVVTTMTWAVLYMLHYPQVQRRLQAELDEHLQDRPFATADRTQLHYFRASVDELQRIVNVLPWNIPHSTSREVTIGEWILPKDTIVMTQYGAVHYDPAIFPDPDVFRPERFLDEKGKYRASEVFKPFGLGKRRCMGEGLAGSELSIVFAALLQNFNIEPVRGEEMPSLRRNPGMTSTPDPFKFIARLRHQELILG